MEQELLEIQAKYITTIFRNDVTGYTVAKFRLYHVQEKDVTVTGIFSNLQEDSIYHLHGYYQEHPRYGMQFQVQTYEKAMPNDRDSLIRFFSGPQFQGIGRKTAQIIVEILGKDAISKIKEDSSVLDTIYQLNEKKRKAIVEGILANDDLDDSIVFLTQHGVSQRNIMKIEAVYGNNAITQVKENPYQLVEDIDGIGFATADKLAKLLEFEDDHPYRIRAALLSCIQDICIANGDSYVTADQLDASMRKKYNFICDLNEYLTALIMDRQVIIEDDRIYHHDQYDAENGIAQFLLGFPYVEQAEMKIEHLEEDITKLEENYAIHYEAKQKEAIQTFFDSSFSILTGGPGTGKTTIVKGILSLYKKYFPQARIALCAPTGRAAKRLSELSDVDASTIHRLLKWNLETNTFDVDDRNPIPADLLIIDEFSMVDQWLFYNLLRACKSISQILIIGDEDQLPSVGPGMVLANLIQSDCFPCVRLEKIFRQSEGSDVVSLAHEILKGECKTLDTTGDVAFFECANYEVKHHILTIVNNAFDKGYELKDIQVLAPMYGGVAGIDALNNALQQLCNPADGYKRELKIGYRIFREEDKVLQLKNQPDDDVYNGDIGRIVEIIYRGEEINNMNKIVVDFEGTIVEYSGEQINNITHAYCISIHKSQGSEYPIVIMPILKDYRFMLQKRLVYTGITRAKQSLVLLGERASFEKSIHADERRVRKTTLIKRLQELFA